MSVASIYNCLHGIVVVLEYPEKDRKRGKRRRGRRPAPVFALTLIWKSSSLPDLTTLLRQDTCHADYYPLSAYPSRLIRSSHSILETVNSTGANRLAQNRSGENLQELWPASSPQKPSAPLQERRKTSIACSTPQPTTSTHPLSTKTPAGSTPTRRPQAMTTSM